MLNRTIRSGFLALGAGAALAGCTLVTPVPEDKNRPVGDDLVINEVFTLPPDRYYAFSWIEMYNPTDRTIDWFDETFPASLNAAGLGGTFLVTENDGDDWASPPSVPAVNFNGIDFPYPDTGYAVGDGAAMYRVVRVAGQYEFFPVTVPTTENLNSVTSIPLTVSGFAAGDRGTVLRTTTRGQTWVAQNSGTTKNIRCIRMATVSRIFGCGDSGLVLRSLSSGNWARPPLPAAYATTNFYTIGTTGSLGDTGWVAGDNGTILISRNLGAPTPSWFAETTNTLATIRGSFFQQGTMNAWAVGDSGVILRKRTTGLAWERQNSGVTTTLRAVSFLPPQPNEPPDRGRGWAVGDGGVVLVTTNSGNTWRQLSSGTSSTLTTVYNLPLNIRVLNRYVLQMYAKRKEFFFDPLTGTINFDYIINQDTGWLYFDPEILVTEAGAEPPPPIPSHGFAIINSDSGRFQEHTDIGPGRTSILNFSIGFYYDSTSQFGVRPVLWDLLQSGEVRLIKQFFRVRTGTGEFLGLTTETVDVVRWGGFMPTVDMLPVDPLYPNPGPELIYPNNTPAGAIPEWWSLARYVDDVGAPVTSATTSGSFYMSDRPVPGYYSQLGKPK